jgi:transposase-like protein
VQLANQNGILAKDVAESLGIHPIMLYRWRKEYKEGKLKRTSVEGEFRFPLSRLCHITKNMPLRTSDVSHCEIQKSE